MEVRFSDTGVPWLDVKDAENPASHAYSVLPISHRKLLLRDVSANLPSQTDTSCGKLWINFPRSFVAVGVFQIPFIFLFACCTGSAFACIVYFQGTERLWPMLCSSSRNVWQRCARIQRVQLLVLGGPSAWTNSWNSSIIFKVIFASGTCVCHKMLLPMTRLKKLSYAEVAGPSTLQWFVSHYWGTPEPSQACGMASDEWQARRGLEV